MLKAVYDWAIERVSRPDGERWLFGLAVAEATFFPIPPDILLIPMVLADRARAWRLAFITTLASIVGAAIGYGLGHYFYQEVGQPILEFYGYQDRFDEMAAEFEAHGFWILLVVGLTPIPFKLVTITSGAVGMNFLFFLLACIPARAPRFFVVSALLWLFGERIRAFIEKRLALVFTLFVILLVGGFYVVKVAAH